VTLVHLESTNLFLFQGAASSLVPLFAALTESCPYLNVSIYCTRERLDATIPEKLEWKRITFYSGRPGRVGLTRTLDNAIARLSCVDRDGHDSEVRGEQTGGMLVGICGPVGLGEEVRNVVDGIPTERQKQVGGVQIHEECVSIHDHVEIELIHL
jgi:ferric-chelate reductase